MAYRIEYTGFCIQGLVRKNNEDNLWCRDHCLPVIHTDEERNLSGRFSPGQGGSFAVFDGMGGEECGEAAAYIAARTFGKNSGSGDRTELCREMNRKVLDYADSHRIRSMGSTVTGLRFGKDRISGFNLGDSRCYLFSDGQLTLLSEDHTILSMASGKEMLTQCLGISEKEFLLEPYRFDSEYKEGEIFLLCSDGVSRVLGNGRLSDILGACRTIREKAGMLRDAVLKRGAPDNATALLFEIRKESAMAGLAEKIGSFCISLI